jgi:hypothetical protein
MSLLSTQNKRVVDFYASHPFLDFEQINLLCVDLFENILQNSSTINKSIGSQILSSRKTGNLKLPFKRISKKEPRDKGRANARAAAQRPAVERSETMTAYYANNIFNKQ